MMYVFTPSEGDAIPKDGGVAVADDMRNKVKDRLGTVVNPNVNSFYNSATCVHYARCEAIVVHAEHRGHKIIVTLKFNYWARPLGPHPDATEGASCLVEEGTDDKDCLDADLGVLTDDLIFHNQHYHGGK